jgi:hypothetical protein
MDPWTNITDGDVLTYPKISVTELYSLLRCTQKHEYGYRRGLRPTAAPSYFGKGRYLHGLMETFLNTVVEGAPVRDVGKLGNDVLMKMAEQRAGGDPSALVAEPDRVEINGLFDAYMQQLNLGGVEVLAIEQPFYVDMGWTDFRGVPVLLHGVLDAVLAEGDDLWVVEHKTASRAWSQGQFNFDFQSPLYNRAVELVLGVRPTGTQFNFFYPKRFESKLRFVTPTESELLVAEVQLALDLRESGTVVRQPHWGCNDCSFRNLCHAELIGADVTHMLRNDFTVDEAKLARFAEEE